MNKNICFHYIVGVSLGQTMQPTAIAILEQETRVRDKWQVSNHMLRLRYLERVSLDMLYPELVDHIDALKEDLADKEQAKETDLVVDVTGTGSSVGDLMDESSLSPIRVTITAGTAAEESKPGEWRIPKTELVGSLQVALQSGRLEMARGLELVPTLVKELQAFKLRSPVINDKDPESWREGEFDDLVFAVGLANWRANKHIPTPQWVHDDKTRMIKEHNSRSDGQWV